MRGRLSFKVPRCVPARIGPVPDLPTVGRTLRVSELGKMSAKL